MKLRSSKTKLFCETSFKNEAVKLKKGSFSARIPSKMKLRSSKTKLFCETSFKNEAVKLKKGSFSARLPLKMILRARIGSQATTKGAHHFRVAGVGFQAHIVTCDPIIFTSKRRNSE